MYAIGIGSPRVGSTKAVVVKSSEKSIGLDSNWSLGMERMLLSTSKRTIANYGNAMQYICIYFVSPATEVSRGISQIFLKDLPERFGEPSHGLLDQKKSTSLEERQWWQGGERINKNRWITRMLVLYRAGSRYPKIIFMTVGWGLIWTLITPDSIQMLLYWFQNTHLMMSVQD